MELKDIAFDELLHIVEQLPEDKKSQLRAKLDKSKQVDVDSDGQSLTQLLLNGPVMSDEEYNNYKDARKWMNKWRKK